MPPTVESSGSKTSQRTDAAPLREPEVWDERIPAFNPRFARMPEPEPVAVSPAFAGGDFDVQVYLREERDKDLLRFSTAGSVDDGKSTLIGRLLYDTQSVYDDQLQSIEGKGTTAPGVLDLALLTDGLRAEREQGITIDVAYRYFSTPRRKFIIADTPGHEQYTRNMATGASTADVAIVLIDARKGVLPQSRRHAYITALLGVQNVIVAVNKMDLVGYAEEVFRSIEQEFRSFFASIAIDGSETTQLHFVPVSALAGDNVAHLTDTMPWYAGPSLLSLLETIPASERARSAPFRMAVQRVIRPNLDFRGFAGQIAAGTVRPGDEIVALPSGLTSRVQSIVTYDGELAEASAPRSVTLTLTDEIDISRGDLLASPLDKPAITQAFTASLVWMDAAALETGKRYLLKHMSRTVQAQVTRVLHHVNLLDLAEVPPETSATLALNSIGLVEIETLLPLAADRYALNRHTGSFVLIDPQTNATVAAGMIRQTGSVTQAKTREAVSPSERIARYGHAGAHLHLVGPSAFSKAVERALFDLGANVTLTRPASVAPLVEAGLLAITSEESAGAIGRGLSLILDGRETRVAGEDEGNTEEATTATLNALRAAGVLRH